MAGNDPYKVPLQAAQDEFMEEWSSLALMLEGAEE